MRETAVQRWRKYGKDRLYINVGDGTRIGWHDVLTSEDHGYLWLRPRAWTEVPTGQDELRLAVHSKSAVGVGRALTGNSALRETDAFDE
jgi:hypothetical protein